MKKNICAVIGGAMMLLGSAACAKAPGAEEQAKETAPVAAPQAENTAKDKKILVAYYSYCGGRFV